MMKKQFRKILVANRGEIAVRVMRTCKELGIATVAVYSDPDENSMHVRYADERHALNGSKASETYLDQSKILAISRAANVDAVHPGYGFLSENADFAEAVVNAGLKFIGPSATSIRSLGDKTAARTRARELGVPTLAGTQEQLSSLEEARTTASRIGYPILLKAAAGGGGKGMRIVLEESELDTALRSAHSEALSAFADDRVFMEKYIDRSRHIEVQILADAHGNAVYLGERECSIQRRHQKVIEETPSPIVDEKLRASLGKAALDLIRSAGYENAGTVEFIVDEQKHFYFLEVNTRLQVEHPVTELITGIDLVREQIRVAQGEELGITQESIRRTGHSIECRIYAEDPADEFFPSTGILRRYRMPEGARIRVDNGFRKGDAVSPYYDPMLAKICSWGKTRSEAIASMRRALDEMSVDGVETTIPFCKFVLAHEQFVQGSYTTKFVAEQFRPEAMNDLTRDEMHSVALAVAWFHRNKSANGGMNGSLRIQSSKWKDRLLEYHR